MIGRVALLRDRNGGSGRVALLRDRNGRSGRVALLRDRNGKRERVGKKIFPGEVERDVGFFKKICFFQMTIYIN